MMSAVSIVMYIWYIDWTRQWCATFFGLGGGGVQNKNLILCEGRMPDDVNESHISETNDITPLNDKNCYN